MVPIGIVIYLYYFTTYTTQVLYNNRMARILYKNLLITSKLNVIKNVLTHHCFNHENKQGKKIGKYHLGYYIVRITVL